MAALCNAHLEWLQVHAYAERTITTRKQQLRSFIEWCLERELHKPEAITFAILERYQRHLFKKKKPNGQTITFKTQRHNLSTIQQYFKWLTRQKYIQSNPASELELPRVEKRLPRNILTAQQSEQVMNAPDITLPVGLRDRTILEVLYSTGIRRQELINLNVEDIIMERGLLLVRQGKGKKDRFVPIGERALLWVRKYLDEAYLQFHCAKSDKHLFLTEYGEPMLPKQLSARVRKYIETATGKAGSCHLFRHTMASLMLENGADIRQIQKMLGHASIESTEIYTHVTITQLKRVHELTHPAKMPDRKKVK